MDGINLIRRLYDLNSESSSTSCTHSPGARQPLRFSRLAEGLVAHLTYEHLTEDKGFGLGTSRPIPRIQVPLQ